MFRLSEYVDVKTAALRLNVSEETVRRSLNEGLIQGQQRDGVWQVPDSEIRRLAEDEAAVLALPLSPDDMICYSCGERMPLCSCD